MPTALPVVVEWPPFIALTRLILALVLGLFIGLEREWRGKEAGLRTFGFAALLGALGGLMGESYGLLSIALLAVLVVFMNLQSLKAGEGTELTTSAALFITGLIGVLCGLGHTTTPAAVVVVMAGLLAWKENLASFSHKLSADELRSAILLSILTFAVFPVLPRTAVDPWGLVVPHAVWMTVILVAAIGFFNYLLWKSLGNKGVALTGFFGGLVNSSVAVTEISICARDSGGRLAEEAYQGVLLATLAMALRNAVILAFLAFRAFVASIIPLLIIGLSCAVLVRFGGPPPESSDSAAPALPLKSPFSLTSALKFGAIFLLLEVVGSLAQIALGHTGFYGISIIGGLISSASAVASAAGMATAGRISSSVAGIGAVLASLASAWVNWAFVARLSGDKILTRRIGRALAIVLVLAIAGAVLQWNLHLWADI